MLPILKRDSNYILTEEELNFINKLEYNYFQNNNNFMSRDYYVLENDSMRGLRDVITTFINHYRNEVCGIRQDLVLTQSWIAKTMVGGHHARHNHPNSLFSGVFYIDCSDNSPLNFYNENLLFKHFKFDVDYVRPTSYNNVMTQVDIKPNELMMFPSWIEHDVGINHGPRERIVLAFNTFIRGDLGDNSVYPTKLKIN